MEKYSVHKMEIAAITSEKLRTGRILKFNPSLGTRRTQVSGW
jgi:hypothetical protein